MVDRHAQQHQSPGAAQIALEQEAGLIAQQPPGFIHSSANLDHGLIYRVLDALASQKAQDKENQEQGDGDAEQQFGDADKGAGGAAGTFVGIAKLLFGIAIALFLIFLVLGLLAGKGIKDAID